MQEYTQAKSEGMEKNVSHKQKPNENWSSLYLYQTKQALKENCNKRLTWALYSNKRSIQQEDITFINIYLPNV